MGICALTNKPLKFKHLKHKDTHANTQDIHMQTIQRYQSKRISKSKKEVHSI